MMPVKKILAANRRTLLRYPLHQVCPIKLREESRLLLAVRVEDTAAFLTPAVEVAVAIKPWRSRANVPLVVLAYCLTNTLVGCLEGYIYLNPNQVDDYALLLALPHEESLDCLILRRDAQDGLLGTTDLSVHQRLTLEEFMVLFDRVCTEEKGEEEDDPEFERATQEFQQRYRVQEVLAEGALAPPKRRITAALSAVKSLPAIVPTGKRSVPGSPSINSDGGTSHQVRKPR